MLISAVFRNTRFLWVVMTEDGGHTRIEFGSQGIACVVLISSSGRSEYRPYGLE
jgi:hypothetical protein